MEIWVMRQAQWVCISFEISPVFRKSEHKYKAVRTCLGETRGGPNSL